MLILQDHSKYTARRLCVEPYITHSTSGLLKNHQYHVPVYHCGTKSNLGLALNHILVWDQIELKSKTKSGSGTKIIFGSRSKCNLGLGPNRIWVLDQIVFRSGPKLVPD